jgi:hypothetical protein
MHRLILEAKTGELVDHINRNRLDNRGVNLRICDRSEHCQNRTVGGKKKLEKTSKFYGVFWSKNQDGWRTRIMRNKRVVIDGGLFRREEIAARKYDQMARAVYGEFARTNF